MEKDILDVIVEVESEIQGELVAAKRRAVTMLADLRQELAEEAQREEERLAATGQQALAAARVDAQAHAAAIVQQATSRTERLTSLADGTLERWILQHLVRIVPEERR